MSSFDPKSLLSIQNFRCHLVKTKVLNRDHDLGSKDKVKNIKHMLFSKRKLPKRRWVYVLITFFVFGKYWERSGSVVECLTQDRRAVGSSLTGVTALWSLSKTHLS